MKQLNKEHRSQNIIEYKKKIRRLAVVSLWRNYLRNLYTIYDFKIKKVNSEEKIMNSTRFTKGRKTKCITEEKKELL